MNKNLTFIFLISSIVCFALVSLSLFGIFFIDISSDPATSKLSILCGIGFWLFTVLGVAFQVVIAKCIKIWRKNDRLSDPKYKITRIGLLNIFSNIPAIISDVVLCISLIVFIVSMIVDSAGIVAYISLAVLVLSFATHCIFNGKNYYYITNYEYIKDQINETEEIKWKQLKALLKQCLHYWLVH